MSIFIRIRLWLRGDQRSRRQQGIDCAKEIIARGDDAEMSHNYGASKAAPDQDDFDVGFQETMRPRMAGVYERMNGLV